MHLERIPLNEHDGRELFGTEVFFKESEAEDRAKLRRVISGLHIPYVHSEFPERIILIGTYFSVETLRDIMDELGEQSGREGYRGTEKVNLKPGIL